MLSSQLQNTASISWFSGLLAAIQCKLYFVVTSQRHPGVLNIWQFDWILTRCSGQQPVTGGFRSHRASKAENVSLPCPISTSFDHSDTYTNVICDFNWWDVIILLKAINNWNLWHCCPSCAFIRPDINIKWLLVSSQTLPLTTQSSPACQPVDNKSMPNCLKRLDHFLRRAELFRFTVSLGSNRSILCTIVPEDKSIEYIGPRIIGIYFINPRSTASTMGYHWTPNYRQMSYIRRTKYQSLNVSRLVLQLSLPNPLKPECRCSWSSADRRCSNYILVINN